MSRSLTLFAVALTAGLALSLGCDTGPSKADQEDAALASTEPVAVRSIQKDYEANEVGADVKYKGKRFLLTGTVQEISKDFLDDIYITLVGTSEWATVHAYFSEADTPTIAELKKGQKITFYGTVDGFTVGSAMIKKCKFWQEPAIVPAS